MRQWCEYWWKHIVYYGIINNYYWKYPCVLIKIVNIVQQIFDFKEYMFRSFCNVTILFTYLIRQFHFHILLIEKSRVIYHMINGNIKMFPNLLKHRHILHFMDYNHSDKHNLQWFYFYFKICNLIIIHLLL